MTKTTQLVVAVAVAVAVVGVGVGVGAGVVSRSRSRSGKPARRGPALKAPATKFCSCEALSPLGGCAGIAGHRKLRTRQAWQKESTKKSQQVHLLVYLSLDSHEPCFTRSSPVKFLLSSLAQFVPFSLLLQTQAAGLTTSPRWQPSRRCDDYHRVIRNRHRRRRHHHSHQHFGDLP